MMKCQESGFDNHGTVDLRICDEPTIYYTQGKMLELIETAKRHQEQLDFEHYREQIERLRTELDAANARYLALLEQVAKVEAMRPCELVINLPGSADAPEQS